MRVDQVLVRVSPPVPEMGPVKRNFPVLVAEKVVVASRVSELATV